MKVLMLGWELPPHNSGGLGVACFQLCKSLAVRDCNIDFLLPYTAQHNVNFMNIIPTFPQGITEIIKSGSAYDSFKYIYSNGTEEWHDIYHQQYMYEQSVSKMVDKLEFDVIHAHDWLTFRAGLQAKAKSNKPLILHVHSLEHDRAGAREGNPLVHEIEYTAFLLADSIIAVSELTKDLIVRNYNIPEDKIKVVHNSIDRSMAENLDKDNAYKYLESMKSKGYKVISNVGRLTIQKGLSNLLYAAKLVIEVEPKTLFVIVGNGELYYELIELAAQLGISRNVIFTGFLRGKQWRDIFAISDLFVMPSVSEPFGLTPLEAAGYGTPALISKQSGVSEVLINCLKVDYWDIDQMANKIIAVMNYPALHHELKVRSSEEYQQLSWDKAADQITEHYHSFKVKALA